MVLPVDETVHIRLHVDGRHPLVLRAPVPLQDGRRSRAGSTSSTSSSTEPGTYGGQCAEFCGLGHADMYFTVQAVDRPDFDAWVAPAAGGRQRRRRAPHPERRPAAASLDARQRDRLRPDDADRAGRRSRRPRLHERRPGRPAQRLDQEGQPGRHRLGRPADRRGRPDRDLPARRRWPPATTRSSAAVHPQHDRHADGAAVMTRSRTDGDHDPRSARRRLPGRSRLDLRVADHDRPQEDRRHVHHRPPSSSSCSAASWRCSSAPSWPCPGVQFVDPEPRTTSSSRCTARR